MNKDIIKFVKKCILFFLIICVIFVPAGIIIDPYSVFHPDEIKNNGCEPNKNYIKVRHVLKNPDEYDSFLFGSSRVGFFDVSRMNDGNYYDMMASEGVPYEHLRTLKIMIDNGIVPKNVTIGVDDISYFVDPSNHEDQLYRKYYPWDGKLTEKLSFFLRYLDPITLYESIEVIKDHKVIDEEYSNRLLTTGTENLEIIPNFNPENQKPYWSLYYYPREAVFDELTQIVELCEENNINLRVFTNPVYGYTYKRDIENGYLHFLERLAEITPYYNFSGFNDVTLDNKYYYENSHFSPQVCDAMIDTMYYGWQDERLITQGFGMYVTEDNVDELIELLKGQAKNFDIEIDTYNDTINRTEINEDDY